MFNKVKYSFKKLLEDFYELWIEHWRNRNILSLWLHLSLTISQKWQMAQREYLNLSIITSNYVEREDWNVYVINIEIFSIDYIIWNWFQAIQSVPALYIGWTFWQNRQMRLSPTVKKRKFAFFYLHCMFFKMLSIRKYRMCSCQWSATR